MTTQKEFCAQEIVREFTNGAANASSPSGKIVSYPNTPILVPSENIRFISKMVISELLEMILTVEPETAKVKEMLHEVVNDLDLPTTPIPNVRDNLNNQVDVIEAQMDAIADIMYYLLDFCTKHGYNIDKIMSLVHGANMNKRHADGKFHKRADGKVIKPVDWKEADLKTEVIRQLYEGAW